MRERTMLMSPAGLETKNDCARPNSSLTDATNRYVKIFGRTKMRSWVRMESETKTDCAGEAAAVYTT
jgi:hypothetical protein